MNACRTIALIMVPVMLLVGCLSAVDASTETPTVESASYSDGVLTVAGTAPGGYVKLYVTGDGYQSEYASFMVESGRYSGVFLIGALADGTYKAIAFDNSGSGYAEFEVVRVSDVAVDRGFASVVEGFSLNLSATVTPSDANLADVVWSSSDETVATVDQDGRVTALKPGVVLIKVTTVDGGLTDSCELTVLESVGAPTVSSASYASGVVSVSGTATGGYVKLYVTGDGYQSEYASFMVDSGEYSGIFHLGDLPDGTYKAIVFDNNGTGSMEFTVISVTGVAIPETAVIVVGSDTVINAIVSPEAANVKDLQWSSSDESVATVDDEGMVLGISVGTAIITATTVDGGFTDTCTVTVLPEGTVSVTGVDIPYDIIGAFSPGDVVTIPYTVLPTDATDASVTWSFSNGNLYIDAQGVIRVSEDADGDCVVTVTTVDGGFTDSVTVSVTISKEVDVVVSGGEAVVDEAALQEVFDNHDSSDLEIVIDVKSADADIVRIPAASVDKLADAGARFTVNTDSGVVSFDSDFVSSQQGEIVFGVDKVLEPKEEHKEHLGEDFVAYEFDMSVGGVPVSSFTDGSADVTLPYPSHWDADRIIVTHIMDDGNVEKIDWEHGTDEYTATFTVHGFSIYAIVLEPVPSVSGVVLDHHSVTIDLGSSAILTATVNPADAEDRSVTWSSSDPAVASVDAYGRVTGVGVGSATITVTTVDGGFTDICTVHVEDNTVIPVTGVSLDKGSVTMNEGEILQLNAVVSPADATDKGLRWISSDSSVAHVDSSGKVIAKKSGTTTITVITADGAFSDTCRVIVESQPSGAGDNTNMILAGVAAVVVILSAVLVFVMYRSKN